MKRTLSAFCTIALLFSYYTLAAQESNTAEKDGTATENKSPGLTIGGYGEAVYSRHFHSDNPFRYRFPDRYKDAPDHGRFDLPHAVVMIGYDFGHGWSIGTEIEFEHGGAELAVERETEEAAEVEQEIERGGEVALEQFWVQKSFGKAFNIRAGHMVVPVGMTNNNHTPNMFFSVYRPEGENTIMPCTWHETGVEVWGRIGDWRYEAMLLPALNSNFYTESGWIHNASASPYEFRPGNKLATAARLDWNGVRGLRLSLSGYFAPNTFNNDYITEIYAETSRYYGAKGAVAIGAFDFAYRNRWLTLRGNVDCGNLSDAGLISTRNKNQTTMTGNPYPHTVVGETAWDAAIEAGVDILSFFDKQQRLYIFGRYDHYDSFEPATGFADIPWCERQTISGGINYCPIPEVAVKAEAGVRVLPSQYNNEPYLALGMTWTGFFKH